MASGCWSKSTESHGQSPVILLSGYSETQDARLAAAPFARKLLKPITPEKLCEEIAELLLPRKTRGAE
jgi:CheY-like chemotaxis protein